MDDVFQWIKALLNSEKKEPEKIIEVPNIPPKYLPIEEKCKEHWEYNGIAAPTNNCNICWEYHAKKMKH